MHLPDNTLLQGGKYKITRFIASGGFGCTYEAEHVMLRKRVAIKEFFVKDFCNRDETTSHVTVGTQSKAALVSKLKGKFIDEAVSLSTFSHPNIIRVSDVFEENGTAYYVMDFINGKSINAIIQDQGRLSESKAIHFISKIAEALKEVHKQNRLHLDIKPANIMVDEKDNAILIDFGASKQYDEVDGENTSTLIGRTPGYAPLEQLGNDIVKFMPATDIYALGATLYKMLSGETPLSATLLASGEELDPLPDIVTERTKNAVKQSMSINKRKRPQSIEEFLSLIKTDVSSSPLVDNEETEVICDSPAESLSMPIKGECQGHEWVDLGLPSGLKWATCNIGASKPEEFGDYFAWGETEIKSYYSKDDSETYSDSMLWFMNKDIKWLRNHGYIDINDTLLEVHDAARQNWGGIWRMPTLYEIIELRDNCEWLWTSKCGTEGYEIIGPNGNSIFLPAAGCCDEEYNFRNNGIEGFYWSSTASTGSVEAEGLFFYSSYYNSYDFERFVGQSIRPVCE